MTAPIPKNRSQRDATHHGCSSKPPTVEEARQVHEDAENRLLDLWIKGQRAQWVQETFITHDTEQIAARSRSNM